MAIDTDDIRSQVPYAASWEQQIIHSLCDEIDRLRAETKPTPQQQEGKTVQAEAFYAVDRDGYYKIIGMCGDCETQEYCKREACNDAAFDDGPVAFGRLTATLPVPEEREIEAEVENGDG